jgi:hypothetical protein
LVISVRGIGLFPTTSDSAALGVTGAMNAAFGFRADFFFAVFFAALRAAGFFAAVFFFALFFAALAIRSP